MINRLNLFWRCPKCGLELLGPVSDLPEAGIPICSECGDDMELLDGAALSSGSGRKILLVGVQAIPHPLIVKVQRGMVMDVHGIPAGIVVEVRDYDAPRDGGSSGRRIENDDDGPYLAEVYDGSGEEAMWPKKELITQVSVAPRRDFQGFAAKSAKANSLHGGYTREVKTG